VSTCQCSGPGWCATQSRHCNRGRWAHCQAVGPDGLPPVPVTRHDPAGTLPAATVLCVHLELDHIIEYAPCDCPSKHVRGCAVHDLCTLGHNNGSVASCMTCPDKKLAGEP
jgi:hypothetical protein